MKRTKVEEDKVNKKKIKLKTLAIFIVVAIIIIFLGKRIISSMKNNKKVVSTNVEQNVVTIKDITKKQQKNFEITNVAILSDENLTNVSAAVKNTSKGEYKSISINVIFYDSNKKEIATSKGLIENINSGEQKSFSSYITGDYTKKLNYEVQIYKTQD